MEKHLISLIKPIPQGFKKDLATGYSELCHLVILAKNQDQAIAFLEKGISFQKAIIFIQSEGFSYSQAASNIWTIHVTHEMTNILAPLGHCFMDILRARITIFDRHFDQFFKTLPATMYFKDRDSRFIKTNEFYSLKHRNTKEHINIVGQTDFDVFSSEHAQQAYDDEQEIMSTGKAKIGYDEKETWLDGRVTWVNSTKMPIKDDDGTVIGLVGLSYDITNRKLAEEALEEHRERLSLAAKASRLALFDLDITNNKTYWDEEMYKMFGLKPNSEVNHTEHFLSMLHPDDKDLLMQKFEQSLTSEETRTIFRSEYRIIDQNDKISFIETWSRHFLNSDGSTKRVLGTCRDITEVKMNEKRLELINQQLLDATHALEKNNAELEKALEAARRSDELAQANMKLERALRELKEAQSNMIHMEKMASVGVLAAGIAHEINNPLNFISGGAVALEHYCSKNLSAHSKEIGPFIDIIKAGVDRSSGIVKSLGHFNRRTTETKEDCNIHTIINNCLHIMQNRMKDQIDVIKRFTKKEHSLLGNEGELHQVFLNLLTNAVQSIPNKGTITITTRIGKDHLGVSIKDTGKGIPKQIMKNISDPFFTTKAPGEGTGLGISIAENILQKHGGSLSFESEVKIGTTVKVKLPLLMTD